MLAGTSWITLHKITVLAIRLVTTTVPQPTSSMVIRCWVPGVVSIVISTMLSNLN